MAKPEHVNIVLGGYVQLKEWQAAHPGGMLNLSTAQLAGVDLRGVDLRRVNLSGADLSHADLRGSDLRHAQMIHADLRGTGLSDANLSKANLAKANLCNADLDHCDLLDADLSYTNLVGASLVNADLRRADLHDANMMTAILADADLSEVDLSGANLCQAELRGAKLTHAVLGATVLGDLDLSTVRDIELVKHVEPSTIGVDTLLKSGGRLPHGFLRGCGVPDVLIEHIPSLIGAMRPVQFYSCFISYSSKDDEFARRLHGRLEQEGLRVWFAPEDMKGGRRVVEQIDDAIRVHDRLLLVLSPNSMSSEWVRREIKRARRKEKQSGTSVLFPISLVPFGEIRDWECVDGDSGEDLAEKVREYHIPDFSCWKDHDQFEAAFAKLMEDLRKATERG